MHHVARRACRACRSTSVPRISAPAPPSSRHAAACRAAAHRPSHASPNETMRECRAFRRVARRRANCELSRLSTAAPPPRARRRFPPWLGDRLEPAEEFQMHRLDRGDDRAHAAAPSLQRLRSRRHGSCRSRTPKARRLRAARQRQRHAPVIVEQATRHGSRPARRARGAAFLGLVLPAQPVTPITGPLKRARAARARSPQAGEHVVAPPAAARRRRTCARIVAAATTASAAPAVERCATKSMAVAGRRPLIARTASPGLCCGCRWRGRSTASGNLPLAQRRIACATSATSTAAPRSCDPRGKRCGHRVMIAERQHAVADDLAGLVALAGDQQRIARLAGPRSRRGSPRRGRRCLSRPLPRRGSRRGCFPDSRCADCRR